MGYSQLGCDLPVAPAHGAHQAGCGTFLLVAGPHAGLGVAGTVAAFLGTVAGFVAPSCFLVRDDGPHQRQEGGGDQVAYPVVERLAAETVARVDLLAVPAQLVAFGGQQSAFEGRVEGLAYLPLIEVRMVPPKAQNLGFGAFSGARPQRPWRYDALATAPRNIPVPTVRRFRTRARSAA